MARILVADDNKDILILLRDFLEELGHEVKTETDGLQAGIRAKEWKPDLLIADIQMPDFYGTTVAVSLQSDRETADMPIIFISAIAPATVDKMMESIRKQVKHPERLRFLPKPIDFQLLRRYLDEFLPPAAA